ncbi:MAG: LysM peptidoglycan-binding domain-containing protein [Nitrospinota bacterium]
MELRQRGFLLGAAGLVVLLLASGAAASPFPVEGEWSRRFPLPSTLRPAVSFWKKVFTRYRTREAVLHDKEHPALVYGVVRLDGPWRATLSQRRRLRRARKRVRGWLLALARGRAELVPARQRERLRSLLRPYGRRYSFSKAAANLRTQVGLQETIREGLIRAGRYLPRMRAIFRREGLPEELTLLPLVESAFRPDAMSAAGAAGIWQFTRGTGRLFLKVGYGVDERRDPVLSTRAAAKLLKRAYEELGTWPLAITAYNHGIAGMRRAVARVGSRDIGVISRRYRGRRFGFASKNFYAEFLAALEVARESHRHFGSFRVAAPLKFDTFRLPDFLSLGALTRRFPLSVEEVRRLNPALRRPIFQGRRFLPRGYPLRVPPGKGPLLARAYSRIPTRERFATQPRPARYRVRRGENLSLIARRYGLSVRDLMAANGLRGARIYAGQSLRIPPLIAPARPGRAEAVARASAAPPAPSSPPPPEPESVRGVRARGGKRGKEALARGDKVSGEGGGRAEQPRDRAPQTARKAQGPPRVGTIEARPEETLGHYAEWLEVRASDLRRLNGFRFGRPLRVGQRLRLPFTRVSAEEFQNHREEYHASIREDFEENYRVGGTISHTVRKGENLWRLAYEIYEVPTWLLHQYNPGKDLSELSRGERLVVPVVVPR